MPPTARSGTRAAVQPEMAEPKSAATNIVKPMMPVALGIPLTKIH
jgi:hypothetical protein